MRKQKVRVSEEEIDAMIKDADYDVNGKIYYEEFGLIYWTMTDEGENQDMQFFESNGPLNSGSHPSNNAPAADDEQSMTTDG